MLLPSLISPRSRGQPDHRLGLDLSLESEDGKWSGRRSDLLWCLSAREHRGCLIRSLHEGSKTTRSTHQELSSRSFGTNKLSLRCGPVTTEDKTGIWAPLVSGLIFPKLQWNCFHGQFFNLMSFWLYVGAVILRNEPQDGLYKSAFGWQIMIGARNKCGKVATISISTRPAVAHLLLLHRNIWVGPRGPFWGINTAGGMTDRGRLYDTAPTDGERSALTPRKEPSSSYGH